MTDREDKQEGQEAELWLGRYKVRAYYPDGEMWLYRADMTEEEARELLEPLGLNPCDEKNPYIQSLAEETFTEEEADKLIAFMESFKDTKAEKVPALKPTEGGIGVGALPVGGWDGFYMLDRMDNYDLPFKAWAYYDMRNYEPTPEAELRASIYETISKMSLESLQELKKWLEPDFISSLQKD
jgi:hypothetical protein